MKAAQQSIILFILFALTLLLITCKQKSETEQSGVRDSVYWVTGRIEGLDSGQVSVVYYNREKEVSNTGRIEKGAFQMKGKVEYPQFAYLRIEGQPGYGSVPFFLDNGNTTVHAKRDSIPFADISGTPAQEEFRSYIVEMKPFADRLSALMSGYDDIPDADFRRVNDSLDQAYFRLMAEKLIAIKEYVRKHPESFVAASEVLNNFYYNPKVDQLDSVYQFMGSNIRQTQVGMKVLEMVEVAKKTDIGQLAPDFELSDVNGHPTRLSSLRGKVILLDFWASWCGPCREENPNVVAAYQKYHARGFDVLGVSLDNNRKKWLQAIEQDHLTWNHLSDLKGWRSPSVKLYGIGGIPMSYLLDKEGRIIAKNPRGESLEKKLEEIL